MRLSLFKRRKPGDPAPVRVKRGARPELPWYVEQHVEHATLSPREPDDEGPRVMCMFEGCHPFIFSDDTAARLFGKWWPELSADQSAEAVRRLRARIKSHLISARRAARGGSWATRY